MALPRVAPRAAVPPLQVSEIFASVQGEGPFTGRPSIFLRLGICNLSCSWCDTPYTWLYTPTRQQKVHSRAGSAAQPVIYSRRDELSKRTVHDVLEQMIDMAGDGIRNIVVTGGEPLLHKKPLLWLLPQVMERGFKVEIETNATISPAGLPSGVHLNLSPKLSNSHQPKESRIKLDVLNECVEYPSILKFVVDGKEDLREVEEIVDQVGIEGERVFLMPLGTDSNSIRERGKWLVGECMRLGFQYSHRVHVELWGDKRGV